MKIWNFLILIRFNFLIKIIFINNGLKIFNGF